MRIKSVRHLLIAAIALSAVRGARAQTNFPSHKTSAGLLNEWLREQSPAMKAWDLGGQVRVRYQSKQDAGLAANRDFAENLDNNTEYLLLREKVHVGYAPIDWVQLYVEGRDASAHSDERDPSPDEDSFDLHQGLVSFGNTNRLPILLKVGRQELLYGDERFIGIGDWSNVGRSFDAGKLRFQNELLWVDLFGGHVVLPEDDHFNEPADNDSLFGLYASSRQLAPWQESEAFVIVRNTDNVLPSTAPAPGSPLAPSTARDIYMPGVRIKSLPGKLQGWDYSTELAVQFGDAGLGETKRDLAAFAADATAGYSWTSVFGTPRLGAGYTYASGDDDAADDKAETFEPLYGTNHKFYGLMDLWGLRNIQSPRVVASVKPVKSLTLATEYHLLWLAETQDFFYPEAGAGRNGNGYGRNPQFDRDVGSELDLLATYAAASFVDLQLGYGHFFTGDYIQQSVESDPANGEAVDADWFYAQVRMNF